MSKLWVAWIAIALAAAASAAMGAKPLVSVADVHGVIDPITTAYVRQAVQEAETNGSEVLIVTLDTPGGLSDAMNDIVQTLLNAKVPTVAYVYPRGAQAKSAGIFILYASNIAAMSPATSVGAAHPVILGGNPNDPQTQVMLTKLTESGVSQIRALAQRRGHNADWAERAVRKSVSITDQDALKENVVNVVADDISDLLRQIDGMTVTTAAGTQVLHTGSVVQIPIRPSLWQRFLHGLANANVAYLLLLIAIFGIIFELSNPGGIIPGIAGAIALILAIYAFMVLSFNVTGLFLIVIAILMFIADIKVVSHGLLSVGGIICFAIGSFMLFRTTQAFMTVSIFLIVAMTLLFAGFFITIVSAGLMAQRRGFQTGAEGMLGKEGEAREEITEEAGMAFIDGQLWTARTTVGPIAKGDPVSIVAFDGLIAMVEPVREGHASPST